MGTPPLVLHLPPQKIECFIRGESRGATVSHAALLLLPLGGGSGAGAAWRRPGAGSSSGLPACTTTVMETYAHTCIQSMRQPQQQLLRRNLTVRHGRPFSAAFYEVSSQKERRRHGEIRGGGRVGTTQVINTRCFWPDSVGHLDVAFSKIGSKYICGPACRA